MKKTGICGFITICFAFALLIDVTSADRCQRPPPERSVTENDQIGTKLLKINYTSGQTWSIYSEKPVGYFDLEKGNTSYYLTTNKTLDLEEMKETAQDMKVGLQCKDGSGASVKFDVIITLNPSNEFKPTFTKPVYTRSISEDTQIKDSVFLAADYAKDKDFGDSITFDVVKQKNQFDGISSGKFAMTDYRKGLIVVNGQLDYEKQKHYEIQIVAKDSAGNETSTKLKISISDIDDLSPTFLPSPCTSEKHQCQIPVLYRAQMKATYKGEVSILPNAVKAVDMEVNNYSISYSFTHGEPTNIEKYFKIDAHKGIINKEKDLPKNITSPVNLYIQAEEVSPLKHSSVAILIIDILGRNATRFVVSPTKPPDSPSVGELFLLLGIFLSAIFVFSLFGLAFWIRQRKQVHRPLPGSNHYFTRPNLSTKVFPLRDKRTSESYTGGSTIMTTILRNDSDETTSDRTNSEQSMGTNLLADDSVNGRLNQVAAVLETRQRPTPKSLRSLALPIRAERRTPQRDQLEEELSRSVRSEEIFLERKSPAGSNFGTFRSSYSTSSRGIRHQAVMNGTLETYVSDNPTLRCESPSHSISRNAINPRDTEKISLMREYASGQNTSSLRAERCKRGRENVDPERRHSAGMDVRRENKHPRMPTEMAPPIPCSDYKTKHPTPAKPPRKCSNKERKQGTQSYDQQTRVDKILKHTGDRSVTDTESSPFDPGKIPNSLNKLAEIHDLPGRTRRSPTNSIELPSRPVYGAGHKRATSSRARLPENSQKTSRKPLERSVKSLEKRLKSLEKSRASNVRRSQTLERLPKKPERTRRQTPSPPPLLPLSRKNSIKETSSFTGPQVDTHHFSLDDSAQQKRRTPPPLPVRNTNITPVVSTVSTCDMHNSEEDDPQYVNVKYTTLIGDSPTQLTSRLSEFSYSLSRDQSPGDGGCDEDDVYLEPVLTQPCLEADLNIRAKLELILASALQKKKNSKRKKNDKDSEDDRMVETVIKDNSSATDILPIVSKLANSSSSYSSSSYPSSSSSTSERDGLPSKSFLKKSRSSENIFLSSTDVVWPDPETTLAALHQHHLAMEDYTTVCLARAKQERTSPCASVTSNSSNSSRCHFGHVNSDGQFIVDIPCAESNIRVAKAARSAAVSFRDVETSMEVGTESQTISTGQIEASSLRNCDYSAKENDFPQTISFDGIDQYEIVHRHTIPWSSSQTQITCPRTDETVNCVNQEQHLHKANLERDTKALRVIHSEVNILSILTNNNANGHVLSKVVDHPSCSSRSRPIHSSSVGTLDSSYRIADTSIRSECATVMSSELYEPSDSDTDSDCETVRSLKLFDSIFENEDIMFSSAESDSQSVFRACHPIVSAPPDPISPRVTDRDINEIRHEDDEDDEGKEADDEAEDVITQIDNSRIGSYHLSVGLPNGVDAVYKEPVLNAYKSVIENGNLLNEMGPHNTTSLRETFVKMKKSTQIGVKNKHRLKQSDVY